MTSWSHSWESVSGRVPSSKADSNRRISSTGTSNCRLGRCRTRSRAPSWRRWSSPPRHRGAAAWAPRSRRAGRPRPAAPARPPRRRTSASVTSVPPIFTKARLRPRHRRPAAPPCGWPGGAEAEAEVDLLAEHVPEVAPQRPGPLGDGDPVGEGRAGTSAQQAGDSEPLDRVAGGQRRAEAEHRSCCCGGVPTGTSSLGAPALGSTASWISCSLLRPAARERGLSRDSEGVAAQVCLARVPGRSTRRCRSGARSLVIPPGSGSA